MADSANASGNYVMSQKVKTAAYACGFFGLIAFVATLTQDPQRAWMAYLIPLFYFTSLALGGLFFTAIQHLTKAGWSVNIRRISESLTAFLPMAMIASIIFLFGAPELYKWLKPEIVAADPLLQHKAPYLNQTFFWIRIVVCFVLWIWFAKVMVGRSLQQDTSGDESLTHKQVRTSIGFILVFALTYSFFSVDLLMSLEPHWFSTIFGVYTFAGLFQSSLALMIIMLIYLRKKGLLGDSVTADHLHDLGKFMFAFTVFWAYIAYSQYMLIWYANLPEETIFIIPRSEHGWVPVSIFLILGKFIVPFFALLPRWAKRTPAHLVAVSVLILVMQYVDIYWLVYPAFFHETPKFSISEVLIFLGFAGFFIASVARFLNKHKLVPQKDPRQHESAHHHVVY